MLTPRDLFTMFLILMFCFASPGLGATFFTYNGVDSKTTMDVGDVTDKSLSFALQTRSRRQLLFSSYESPSNYFAVGMMNGNLMLQANFSGIPVKIQGAKDIADGRRHDIVVKTSNNITTITYSNTSSNAPMITTHSTAILTDAWSTLLSNRTLAIALATETPIITTFTQPFFGAFSLKHLGSMVPLQGDFIATNVRNGSHSTNPCQHTPCDNGAQCKDIFNDYECDCLPFYTGKDCNETINVNCSISGDLCNNGTCVNLNATEAAISTTGYSDQGLDYFKCNCVPGFTGSLCERGTDECAVSPCRNSATCRDLHLDYYCECTNGWQGKNCTDNINDCSPDPCKNQAKCTDLVADYNCTCYLGRYKGKNCTDDVDECTDMASPCSNRGTCQNRDHGYDCSCNDGFYGSTCQYNSTEYCAAASPCNGGSCLPNGTSFYCACDIFHTGRFCDEDVNECTSGTSSPCLNNASCTHIPYTHSNQSEHYRCNCSELYEGVNCQTLKSSCRPNPCMNGGVCSAGAYPDFTCACSGSYTGTDCRVMRSVGDNSDNTTVIIVAVVVVVVVVIIAIILFICYYKKHSGQEGTYKPGEEENKGGIDGKELEVIKKPKVERLI